MPPPSLLKDRRVISVLCIAFSQTVFTVCCFSYSPFFIDWMLVQSHPDKYPRSSDVPPSLTNYFTGLLLSSAPMGMFLTSGIWGRFADIWGCRISLFIGIAATVAGTAAFGMIENVWIAISVNFIMGAFNGNWGIMCTYLERI